MSEEVPAAVEPPVAAEVATAVSAPEVKFIEGPCVVCSLQVSIPDDEQTYRRTGDDWGYCIMCAVCKAEKWNQDRINETLSLLSRYHAASAFFTVNISPALRRSGVFPKFACIDYSGDIQFTCRDREQGMRLAGLFGHLLMEKNRWKKAQEYNAATLRLSGEVMLPGDLKLTMSIQGVAPSPSCTITYEEVDVPARKERKVKITCKDPNEDPIRS